jgi:hypothetical protein
MNKNPEKFLEWLLHATIPLLLVAVVKLAYEVYFGAHPSDERELSAQQIMFQNLLFGMNILILLAIGAGVFMLVKRSDPTPGSGLMLWCWALVCACGLLCGLGGGLRGG